jgi:UbiD family decarboxylase
MRSETYGMSELVDLADRDDRQSSTMMIGGRHMTGLPQPQQRIGMIWQEWVKIGKPMPFSAVRGRIPAEVKRRVILGTLYGEPVEVVKCETVDLEVPRGRRGGYRRRCFDHA